ncbi:hypothetical protein ACT4UT_12890, partial [Bacillus sp. B-TM1]
MLEMTQETLYSSQLEIAILDYVRSYYKMKVLAIDTSNYVMGVSLIEEGNVIGEIITNLTKNHSVRLMPAATTILVNSFGFTPHSFNSCSTAG